MKTIFNPNELMLQKIRAVEEYDTTTNELVGRYTQVEQPALQTSADGTEVTDAMGTPITTFYQAQRGTFTFSNSLFSLDLAASQFGTAKKLATEDEKIIIPVSEVIEVKEDATIELKYIPVGVAGAEIKYVKVINENNTFGETFEVSATTGEDKFTIDAANKKITLPAGTKGRVFVNYNRESAKTVKVSKRTDGVPKTVKLLIHAIFHDPCDVNIVYAGTIVCERAQHDPSTVDINLTPDGKHAANYILQKPYCGDDTNLFDILVSED